MKQLYKGAQLYGIYKAGFGIQCTICFSNNLRSAFTTQNSFNK